MLNNAELFPSFAALKQRSRKHVRQVHRVDSATTEVSWGTLRSKLGLVTCDMESIQPYLDLEFPRIEETATPDCRPYRFTAPSAPPSCTAFHEEGSRKAANGKPFPYRNSGKRISRIRHRRLWRFLNHLRRWEHQNRSTKQPSCKSAEDNVVIHHRRFQIRVHKGW